MHADFLVIGAGIMGLSIARELRVQYPDATILVLEKEAEIGRHASGRNSGVLHSGIYYPEGSLKAKFCLEGSRLMAAYCDEHGLPIHRIGKVIVPQKETDAPVLDALYHRAKANGARVDLISAKTLQQMEPQARSALDVALFSPETSVIDPKAILKHLHQTLMDQGVRVYLNQSCVLAQLDVKRKTWTTDQGRVSYGHLFNATGLYADKVAEACGLSSQYTMIPFRGMYYELCPKSSLQLNHLIYPVPDMNVPFLGVHFTKSVQGKIYIGPTAIPVLGREHYAGWRGINPVEAWDMFRVLGGQYLANKQEFRAYAHDEIPRFIKSRFLSVARTMVPKLDGQDLKKSSKVGIRAQLFDKQKRELVMDFLVCNTENETHVLNAVSPAFTSAFSFAKQVVRLMKESL